MSKLEDNVVSLETARRLVEAGIKVDSYFWWYELHDHSKLIKVGLDKYFEAVNRYGFSYKQYPAPTFEELRRLLAKGMKAELYDDCKVCEVVAKMLIELKEKE